MKIWNDHTALSVADLDASAAWYRQMLGFEEEEREYVPPAAAAVATLRRGELRLELFRPDQPLPMDPARSDPDRDPQTLGVKHLCLGTDDLEGLAASLREKGADVALGPVRKGSCTLYYIRDNTGNLIELMQRDS